MTTGNVLPTEGTTTLDDVARAIATAPKALGVEDTAELKSVLVPIGDGKYVSFAAVLRVGWTSDLPREGAITREAGGITLFAMRFGASDLEDSRDLTSLLDQWRVYGHYLPALDFQDAVHIYRHDSYSEWSVEPTWVLQLQEKTTNSLNRQLRTGPFLDPENGFFAENIGEAARKWIGDPGIDQSSALGIYKIAIRDRRAWLKDVKVGLDSGTLSVGLERTTKSKVFLTVICKELDGKKTETSHELVDSSAVLPIPTPLAEIRVCLTDATGVAYDDLRETEQYRPRGRRSILHPPPAKDPEYQELRDALDAGESETVEFKEWLPVDRKNKKSKELLKAATAFANAYGGVIYIGVTDDCEVVGTEKQLGKDELRDEYARVLRLILNQGISPSPAHHVSWVRHAGYHVCRIQVLSKGALHHVVEDKAIYIRRGGSDRLATPAEIEGIVAQSAPKRGGLYPL